jgi:hypothetical protein
MRETSCVQTNPHIIFIQVALYVGLPNDSRGATMLLVDICNVLISTKSGDKMVKGKHCRLDGDVTLTWRGADLLKHVPDL